MTDSASMVGGVYRVGLDGTGSSVYAFDGVVGAYSFAARLPGSAYTVAAQGALKVKIKE